MEWAGIFEKIEGILIALPILIASLASLASKVIRIIGYRREKKNGGTSREYLGRIETKVDVMKERIVKLEKIIKEVKK